MVHRVARGIAALVAPITLAGCASATSARSITPAGSSVSVVSSTLPTTPAASSSATCGSVGTHDFSVKTALYRADPGALPCLLQAVAVCRPASLQIWQTAVDIGVDYLLTITGPASDGCDALLAGSGFGPGRTRRRSPPTAPRRSTLPPSYSPALTPPTACRRRSSARSPVCQ